MNREELLKDTISKLEKLPEDKIVLAHEFTEFLYKKYEEYILSEGTRKLSAESKSFDFLKNDENIYTINDIKEKCNEKG